MSGLVGGAPLGVIHAMRWGPGAGMLWGLAAGLGAVLEYWLFRIFLWRHRIMPLRLLRWLEYTVHLRILYREGGGYVFIHKTLQDSLASNPRAQGPQKG